MGGLTLDVRRRCTESVPELMTVELDTLFGVKLHCFVK